MNKDQNQSFNARVLALQILITLFIALVFLRLFIISIARHGYYGAVADSQHSYSKKLSPTRGDILVYDRNSPNPYPVATDTTQDMVYAIPKEIQNPQPVASTLGPILNMDPKDILAKISDPKKSYVPIMHALNTDQSKQINDLKISGIYLDPEPTRVYPQGEFLSQVLGFVGYKENNTFKVGLYGLEKYFEKDLAGTAGQISTQADLKGNWISGSQRDYTPVVDGSSLVLTIDRAIQYKTEQVLKDAVQKHGADLGTAIVVNPKTGAILAMATEPSFDPNQYNKATDPSVYLNQATTQNYEPGSTMKSITMSSGLDQGLITPQTTYVDNGYVDIDGYKIKNSEGHGFGVQTMTDVLDKSLNTGAIFVEQQLGNTKFKQYIDDFGFGKATNVELPETIGDINNLKGNIQINYYTASFGQGVTVTPIQMIQAYTALANGGKMMRPYIVDSEIHPDGTVIKTQPTEVSQVISDKASSLISAMLVDDVENGFGKKAGVAGYYIGGKTGTAQVVANGKYIANDNIGSFIGYGPIENPQFLILVNINHPRDVAFAETTTAPAFHDIAEFILNYYQIPPTRK